MTATVEQIVAPPWQLTGEGHLFIYRFPEAFVQEHIPPFLHGRFNGGWGTVMLVNYHTSPVGPYHELLFVPGLFDVGRRWTYSITTIFVSTQASVISGQANWGIPKQFAEFERKLLTDDCERITVSQNGVCFFDITLRNGTLQLPVNTEWLPIHPAIIQQHDAEVLRTQPTGSGKVKRAKIEALDVDDTYFPDISTFKPIVTLNVPNFTLTFPIPAVMES